MSEPVIDVRDVSVTYRTGFRRRPVAAVRDATFSVQEGEVFAFLGPNGAGKTTTIRVLMGLISATGGECRLFGDPIPSRAARRRLGFLPESPYFHDYLTVTELVDLSGRLFGLDRKVRRERAEELISLVGLEHARDMPMRRYSKGMLQRAGIAQALVNDPQLVVLDEPMSGLDPIGRKEVRDIILSLRDRGKTVFFSSHILPDVEMLCDRVGMIVDGCMLDVGELDDLMSSRGLGTDVLFQIDGSLDDGAVAAFEQRADAVRRKDRELAIVLPADADVDEVLALARDARLKVVSVTPRHRSLEEVFLARAKRPAAGDRATP